MHHFKELSFNLLGRLDTKIHFQLGKLNYLWENGEAVLLCLWTWHKASAIFRALVQKSAQNASWILIPEIPAPNLEPLEGFQKGSLPHQSFWFLFAKSSSSPRMAWCLVCMWKSHVEYPERRTISAPNFPLRLPFSSGYVGECKVCVSPQFSSHSVVSLAFRRVKALSVEVLPAFTNAHVFCVLLRRE